MQFAARLLASLLLLTLSLPVAVANADLGQPGVRPESAEVAGVPDNTLTVTAMTGGSPDTSYTGTVDFTSADRAPR